MQKILLSIFLLIFSQLKAQSCSCGSMANPISAGGPIITIPAYTLDQGQIVLGTSMQNQDLGEISSAELRRYGRRDVHVHSQDGSMNIILNAGYGITDNLTMLVSYPYTFKSGLRASEHFGSILEQGDSVGFGDLSLQARYRFLDSGCSGIQATLLAGIKMPTGETSERDSEGFKLAADDQPGTGSWDPVMGLAISKLWGPFAVSTNGLYRLSTKGTQNTIVGDVAAYNLALTYRPEGKVAKLFPQTVAGHELSYTTVLELNGLWQESGSNTVFITPGLTIGIDQKLFVSAALGFPVIDSSSEIQPETGMQFILTVNYLI